MKRIVRTKEELKKAVADGVEEIVVAPELLKEIKPIIAAMRLPAKKLLALIGFLGASAAGIIASLALTPTTGGLSGVMGIIVAAPSVAVFAASSGIEVALIALLIMIAVKIGIDSLVKLLRAYDVEEDGFEIGVELGKKGKQGNGPGVRFKHKTKYRESKK